MPKASSPVSRRARPATASSRVSLAPSLHLSTASTDLARSPPPSRLRRSAAAAAPGLRRPLSVRRSAARPGSVRPAAGQPAPACGPGRPPRPVGPAPLPWRAAPAGPAAAAAVRSAAAAATGSVRPAAAGCVCASSHFERERLAGTDARLPLAQDTASRPSSSSSRVSTVLLPSSRAVRLRAARPATPRPSSRSCSSASTSRCGLPFSPSLNSPEPLTH